MNAKRIWLYCERVPPDHTGAGLRGMRHAKYFSSAGYDVAVLTTTKAPQPADGVDHLVLKRVGNHGIIRQFTNLVAKYRDIEDYIAQIGAPDILHHFGGGINASVIAAICRKHKISSMSEVVVTLPENSLKNRMKPNRYLRGWGLRRVDRLLALSDGVAKSVKEAGISRPVVVIPNGIDLETFKPSTNLDKAEVRRRLKIPEDGKLILMVGEIGLRKGYDLGIRLLKVLLHEHNAHLLAVGPWDEKGMEAVRCSLNEDERAIMESDRVIFVGQVENVRDYFHASDVFLFPSRKEGFGTVLIEAMAARIPVVCSLLEGITNNIIEDGMTGFIAKKEDVAEYRDLVEKALNASVHEQGIVEQAFSCVSSEFSEEAIYAKYENIYQTIG